MKTQKLLYTQDFGWSEDITQKKHFIDANLVLIFASPQLIQKKELFENLKSIYPNARIVSVSTGGEIFDAKVHEESFVVSAMQFDSTRFEIIEKEVPNAIESYSSGQEVMKGLMSRGDVKYALVFAGGTEVPGTALVEGLRSVGQGKVPFSGGLAGDGMNFKATLLGVDGVPKSGNKVIVIGFYGENIEIIGASIGGWDTFGMKQVVTKSEGSIVYELNNEPALDVYEKYLCELGAELPESGIVYPMSISSPDSNVNIIRTVLYINREDKSVTFGGEVPEGYNAQIMKSNYRRLVNGSVSAIRAGIEHIPEPDAAILISCIGRKLALKQRTAYEIELIHEILSSCKTVTGFYSYGEIGPFEDDQTQCHFHNQTMTVLLFTEKAS